MPFIFKTACDINFNLNVLYHTLHMHDADSLHEAERHTNATQ